MQLGSVKRLTTAQMGREGREKGNEHLLWQGLPDRKGRSQQADHGQDADLFMRKSGRSEL